MATEVGVPSRVKRLRIAAHYVLSQTMWNGDGDEQYG
jgi:hypothetical protein